jgi:steroid delta-isomerase-like uncharacterized protein
MKKCWVFLLGLALCSCALTRGTNAPQKQIAQTMNEQKKIAALWYEVFETKKPDILDRILTKDWVDIPPAPNQPAGPAGAKQILVELGTTFPDLKIKIEDMVQEGNKVVVRSTITGTQKGPLIGFAAKNRSISIQAIDIHEIKDGKIARTWHTEDWMTGLHQLGVFEK